MYNVYQPLSGIHFVHVPLTFNKPTDELINVSDASGLLYALECFFKLQTIVRNHSQVMYQIANLYELMGDMNQAVEWYFQVQNNLFVYSIKSNASPFRSLD